MNKEYLIHVAEYMLPRPRKRRQVSVIVNDGEWLPIIKVEAWE